MRPFFFVLVALVAACSSSARAQCPSCQGGVCRPGPARQQTAASCNCAASCGAGCVCACESGAPCINPGNCSFQGSVRFVLQNDAPGSLRTSPDGRSRLLGRLFSGRRGRCR
jgi:hypothetical protein